VTTQPATGEQVNPAFAYFIDDAGPYTYAEAVARQPVRTEDQWQRYEQLEAEAADRSLSGQEG